MFSERKCLPADPRLGTKDAEIAMLVACKHPRHVANLSIARFGDAVGCVRNDCPTRYEQTFARNKESVAGPQKLSFGVENGDFNNRRRRCLRDFPKFRWRRLRRWGCCDLRY